MRSSTAPLFIAKLFVMNAQSAHTRPQAWPVVRAALVLLFGFLPALPAAFLSLWFLIAVVDPATSLPDRLFALGFLVCVFYGMGALLTSAFGRIGRGTAIGLAAGLVAMGPFTFAIFVGSVRNELRGWSGGFPRDAGKSAFFAVFTGPSVVAVALLVEYGVRLWRDRAAVRSVGQPVADDHG